MIVALLQHMSDDLARQNNLPRSSLFMPDYPPTYLPTYPRTAYRYTCLCRIAVRRACSPCAKTSASRSARLVSRPDHLIPPPHTYTPHHTLNTLNYHDHTREGNSPHPSHLIRCFASLQVDASQTTHQRLQAELSKRQIELDKING